MMEVADIKRQALDLGFSACGIARAERVDDKTEQGLRKWLSDGMNAGMDYMDNYLDMRLDPRLIMPGLKTIVSVALNYAPAQTMPKDQPQMASYALGQDYHTVMRDKLLQLAARIMPEEVRFNGKKPIPSTRYRVFVDSGPVLERYWAVKAGLGWVGKNHQLIIPHAGSMFFLGELFLDIELPPDDPMPERCGICRRCIDRLTPCLSRVSSTLTAVSLTRRLRTRESSVRKHRQRWAIASTVATAASRLVHGTVLPNRIPRRNCNPRKNCSR